MSCNPIITGDFCTPAGSGNRRLQILSLLYTPACPLSAQLFPFPTSNIGSDSLRLAHVCGETCEIKCSEKNTTSSNFIKESCWLEWGSRFLSSGSIALESWKTFWQFAARLLKQLQHASVPCLFLKQKLNEGKQEKEFSVTLADLF